MIHYEFFWMYYIFRLPKSSRVKSAEKRNPDGVTQSCRKLFFNLFPVFKNENIGATDRMFHFVWKYSFIITKEKFAVWPL